MAPLLPLLLALAGLAVAAAQPGQPFPPSPQQSTDASDGKSALPLSLPDWKAVKCPRPHRSLSVPSSPRSGRPARGVPAVGSPVRPDGEPGGPVRDAGLDRVLRAERVRRLQLRRLARVPHHAPERHRILESDRDPARALQLDGAGLSGFEQ